MHAEAIITAGIIAYLQRANPSLLQTTAMVANDQEAERERIAVAGGWRGTRPLWIGLGVLMVACPLGLLAAGMAWGEWGTDDLAKSGGSPADRPGFGQYCAARARSGGYGASVEHMDRADAGLCASLHA